MALQNNILCSEFEGVILILNIKGLINKAFLLLGICSWWIWQIVAQMVGWTTTNCFSEMSHHCALLLVSEHSPPYTRLHDTAHIDVFQFHPILVIRFTAFTTGCVCVCVCCLGSLSIWPLDLVQVWWKWGAPEWIIYSWVVSLLRTHARAQEHTRFKSSLGLFDRRLVTL